MPRCASIAAKARPVVLPGQRQRVPGADDPVRPSDPQFP